MKKDLLFTSNYPAQNSRFSFIIQENNEKKEGNAKKRFPKKKNGRKRGEKREEKGKNDEK